jgi:hypothetical protein
MPAKTALLLSCCHKKQEHLFASLRLCVFARDILVAAIRIRGILRLSSAACRQVSENSRTFPPFEKGGLGGISIVILVTQKRGHPESPVSPPVSSRGASATRNPQLRAQARGVPKPEKTLEGIIAKL